MTRLYSLVLVLSVWFINMPDPEGISTFQYKKNKKYPLLKFPVKKNDNWKVEHVCNID